MTPASATLTRSRRVRATLALALSLLALATAMLTSDRAEAHPLVTGITNLGTNNPLAFDRTRNAGAGMVRIQLYWGGAAPTARPASWNPANPNDPEYHWDASDEAVQRAVAAGLTPVIQVDGAPSWAQRCQTPASLGAICDPSPADLRAFAQAVGTRYSGRTPGIPAVKYFQGLNEPNLSLFFLPQYETSGKAVSPYLYRDLINAFYDGIKTAEPNALVVAAGLGPVAVPKYTVGPIQFTKLMLCMTGSNKKPRPAAGDCGGPARFDIFAMQPYSTGGPTHEGGPNDVQIGDLPKLQRLIKAANKAGRIQSVFKKIPLWVTEFSWDSKPPDPGGLPMKIEVRWVPEAMHSAWSAGVSNFFWFSLRDDPHDPSKKYSETLESGLYFRGATLEQDRPKAFLAAFRFPFVAYPGKRLDYWGRTPTSSGGRVQIQLLDRKRWKTVKTVTANKIGIFRGNFPSAYGRDKNGAARARFGREIAPSFSMKPVRDYHHPPFG